MKHNEESKKKMKKNHPNVKGENNPMFGKKHSEEIKRKITEARTNRKWVYDPITGTQRAIDKNCLAEYIRKGWKLGRIKYKKGPSYLLSF